MAKRDFYEVLGIDKSADDATIKKAYRTLAKKYHPDMNPNDAEAAEHFKEVGEAYEVLSDPDKKAKYDQFGMAAFENGGMGGEGGFGGFGGFSGEDINIGDIFSSFFGGGGGFGGFGGSSSAGATRARRGEDVTIRVILSFDEAYKGVKKEVNYKRIEKCSDCNGTGAAKGTSPKTCPTCSGRGRVYTQRRTPLGIMQSESAWSACNGRGKVVDTPCTNCNGKGYIRVNKTLEVNFPAGIDSDQQLVLRGQGNAGMNGGEAGDLYVVVEVQGHAVFERDGADVSCEIPISFVEATLGAEIDIPTLNGTTEKYNIPEGTQTGTTFTLRNYGMPVLNSKSRGALHITVKVETPKNLTGEQKDLLRKFGEACGEGSTKNRDRLFKRLFKKEK